MAFGDPEAAGPSKGGIGHGDIGYGSGQVDPGLAAAAGSYGAGSGLGQSVGSASAGGAGGADSSDMSIEAFRDAIARAMGVTAVTEQEAVSQAQTEAELDAIANARARSAAVEARDKAQREAREQQEREAMMAEIEAMQNVSNFATPAPATTAVDLDAYDARFASPHSMVDETEVDPSMFDDPTDTTPALDPEAFREQERALMGATLDNLDPNVPGIRGVEPQRFAHLSTYHGQNTRNFNTTGFDPSRSTGLHDPQGTEAGLAAAQAAMDTTAAPTTGYYDPREVNKQVYGETDVVHQTPKGARGFEVVTETEKTALPYSQMDETERKEFWGKLNQIRQATREKQTPLGKALNTAVAAVLNNSTIGTIGRAIQAMLGHFGFNVNPNEVERAAQHAYEVSTQGPDVNRPDSFLETFLNNLPASAYDEPWMKGLNERQIKYYLDRPSELEWVRNLYNQMNLSEGVTGQSGAGTFHNDVIQTQMGGFKQTGIVWKPQSEHDNNLVVLTPPDFDSANASIENEAGDVLDTGRNMGRTNGGRFTYRFSRPGAQYQGPIYLRIGNTRYKIDNPGARVN